MSEKFQPVRGTKDLFHQEFMVHKYIIDTAYNIAEKYGYQYLAVPIFEFTEVFKRSLGDVSDVVSKEMYTFNDKGDRSITLRPEFTASIMRAIVSNGMTRQMPLKCFSTGPLFRYERPEKGRMRQFHQVNLECLGIESPYQDSEVISMAVNFLTQIGIFQDVTLELNSLGDKQSRDNYRAALVEYFNDYQNELSEDSKIRLSKNPLRILDSKDEGDKKLVKNAPLCNQYYTEEAQDFFGKVREGLDVLNIPYKITPHLVRGLDYYCHTIFEFVTDKLGSQGTVLGGGRYNGLIELMGGERTPGIGFAAGIERLVELTNYAPTAKRPIAILALNPSYQNIALLTADSLRQNGYVVEVLFDGDVGKRMKKANKINAIAAIFIGEDEVKNKTLKVKDLDHGLEQLIPLDRLIDALAPFKRY